MIKVRKPGFEEYLAGAFFGYTLSTLPLMIISLILQLNSVDPAALELGVLFGLFVMPNFFGGAMAGWLVSRRSDVDHWKVGIKTGIGCLILSGILTGLLTGQPESLFALAAKFVGATFGGLIYGVFFQRRILMKKK